MFLDIAPVIAQQRLTGTTKYRHWCVSVVSVKLHKISKLLLCTRSYPDAWPPPKHRTNGCLSSRRAANEKPGFVFKRTGKTETPP